MKILNDQKVGLLDNLIKSPGNNPSKEAAANGRQNKYFTDKVELSGRKQEIERIKEKVQAVPALRQDKVDQAREAIRTETYNVNGYLVAKSILKNNLLDGII